MDELPDLNLSIAPTSDELAAFDELVKSMGGVHLDAVCGERTHRFAEGDPLVDSGCGNELMYEIPYIRDLPKLMQGQPAGKGHMTLCAVCDGLILKPRFIVRKVS